jgi:hypothetical protein
MTDASSIPANAIVRFVALLDEEAGENNGVTMLAVQAASLSKLVADQAAATDWTNESGGGGANDGDDDEDDKSKKANAAQDGQAPPPPEMMIPVPIGTAENLRSVVKYLQARLASEQREIPAPLAVPVEDAVDDTDRGFLRSLPNPRSDVIALASIAHYLNIATLRDLMCAQLSSWLCHMTVEEMRTMLGVASDFSDAEESTLRKEFNLEPVMWSSSFAQAAQPAAAGAAAKQ